MKQKGTLVKVFELGLIRAAVFRIDLEAGDDAKTVYSVSFGKRFQRNGIWNTTSSINAIEMSSAIAVLQQAKAFIDQERKRQRDQETLVDWGEFQGDEYLEVV